MSDAAKLFDWRREKVPIPDPYGRNFAVIAEHAQSAGIQEEVLSSPRRQPDPARRKNAQHMSMRKQSDVTLDFT